MIRKTISQINGISKRGLYLLFILLLLGACTSKTDKELMEEKLSHEFILSHLNTASQKYVEMQWDTVYALSDSYIPTQLHLHGEGRCKNYGNNRFHVEAIYNYTKENDSIDYQSTHVSHKELGEIISTFSYGMEIEEIISPDEFIIKLENHRKWSSILKHENLNYAELANVNKTQVHFGMTEAEYEKIKDEFKDYKQFERNFINGLIGDGVYEHSRWHNLQFAKGKLSLIEFHNKDNEHLSYSNLEKYGKFIKDHACRVNRFDVYEMYYRSSFYNLKIYKSTTNHPPTNDIDVSIYWNGWIKLY